MVAVLTVVLVPWVCKVVSVLPSGIICAGIPGGKVPVAALTATVLCIKLPAIKALATISAKSLRLTSCECSGALSVTVFVPLWRNVSAASSSPPMLSSCNSNSCTALAIILSLRRTRPLDLRSPRYSEKSSTVTLSSAN